jgi:hypothetical protein
MGEGFVKMLMSGSVLVAATPCNGIGARPAVGGVVISVAVAVLGP